MLQRNSTVIDSSKSKEFNELLEENAKNQSFWEEVRRKSLTSLNKDEIEKLFNEIDLLR